MRDDDEWTCLYLDIQIAHCVSGSLDEKHCALDGN